MAKPKVIILRAAGTNCDMETAYAFKLAGGNADLVHINTLKEKKSILSNYEILALPGGFTYGDDIASGKILANELKYTLIEKIREFVAAGKLVIGICNGFQVLVKAGLLPDFSGEAHDIDATLSLNDSAKFEDRWCYLKPAKTSCVFTRGIKDIIYLPVAHAEGKFIPGNKSILNELKKTKQIVFRYTNEKGKSSGYPANPNGSVDSVAGICDRTDRVLGMMPHPERHMLLTQHPRWTEKNIKGADGLAIFKNAISYCKKHLPC